MSSSDIQQQEPFALNGAVTFEIVSKVNQKPYKIHVSAPKGKAPKEGWPVVYSSDGNAMFPQIASTANLLRMTDRVVLVGIGYPGDAAINTARRYVDLTPKTSPEVLARTGRSSSAIETGGNDEFLKFIETELKPKIEKQWSIDRSQQSLFGHSLGGLLVLHALFKNPGAFKNYLAAAPSLWWNENSILQELKDFKSSSNWGKSPFRLMVFSNSDRARQPASLPAQEDPLSELLLILQSDTNAQVQHRHYDNEGHMTMVAPSIVAGLRFAIGDSERRR